MSTTPERPDSEDLTSRPDDTGPTPEQAGPEPAEESVGAPHGLDQDPVAPPPPPTAYGADDPPPPPPPSPHSAPPPPPSGGAPAPPPAYGTAPVYGTPAGAVVPLSPQEEKGWSLAAHLLVLVGGFLAPLIIWLVFKGRGPFLEHHAKESLNFQITVTIAMFISVLLIFLLIGFVLILVLIPWMIVMPIFAAVKANNGEWFRYPLTLRLVK